MLRRSGLVAVALAAVLTTATAAAQATPPHRFFGSLTVNGQPGAPNTTITVSMGSQQCGTSTTTQSGRYFIDVISATQQQGCFRGGETLTFVVGGMAAQQTGTFRTGGFEELNLTVGGGQPPVGFNGAVLFLGDPRPCIPDAGQAVCSAEREALWTADRAAWARRGVTDPEPFIPFEGNVFAETIVFRVQAGDPGVIRNIARILGNPYLQITEVKFRGSQPGQTDEYVEITNLGGGPQTMAGWVVRAPAREDETYTFPSGLTLNGGDSCRVYTGAPGQNACGGTSFNRTDLWPDTRGQVILYFAALDLRSAEPFYSSDPASQPTPPNLEGTNLP